MAAQTPDGQKCVICHARAKRGYIPHTQECPQFKGQAQHLGQQQGDPAARYDLFVSKLQPNPRHRDRYTCPSCGDEKHGGLKVDPGRDGPMFHCFGCQGTTEIVEAAGLSWPDIRPPRERREPEAPKPEAQPRATPISLPDALSVFRRWLYIDDDAPVLLVAATVAANNAEGDPLWTLLVGPPSSGKTEALQGIAGLPYVHGAATVTESSLLSGVAKRDRDKDATGGLLRQIGEYGIILCKDFTSVLSQNRDAAGAALAALREIYDGSWDRPTGAGGGRVLQWRGKCGLVGGVTGSIDRFGQVVGALGDRYLLLRLPDVDPGEMAAAALAQGANQKAMRAELSAAMTGLVAGADLSALARPLTPEEVRRLVGLSTFTARARTTVERNGYTNEVLVMPQAEGTARIAGQLRRLLGGLEAIGADSGTAWATLCRVAVDCVPRMRTRVMRTLMSAPGPLGTGDVAKALGVDWKTANHHLGDLRLLEMAFMEIEESAGVGDKARYWWESSKWLDDHFPLEEMYQPTSREKSKGEDDHGQDAPHEGGRTSPPMAPGADTSQEPEPEQLADWDRALYDRET